MIAATLALTDAQRKAWATAQAQAVLAGHTAVMTDTDEGRPLLVVSRWAFTKSFDDLAEFDAWLGRVTGRKT